MKFISLLLQVAYQKILQLSYVDKFLNDIQLEFRDKYKDDLSHGNLSRNFDFTETFQRMLRVQEDESKQEAKAPKWEETNDRICWLDFVKWLKGLQLKGNVSYDLAYRWMCTCAHIYNFNVLCCNVTSCIVFKYYYLKCNYHAISCVVIIMLLLYSTCY